MEEIGERFSAGQRISDSGIYEVIHDRHHRANHQVMCTAGETFPGCSICGTQIRFELAIRAPSIHEEPCFDCNQKDVASRLKPVA